MTVAAWIRFAAGSAVAATLACAPAHPRRVYIVRRPPVEVVEVVPASPGPEYVWVKGHHRWTGDDYVWVPGHWAVPPRGYAVWVPGHWAERDGGWVWIEGHWR